MDTILNALQKGRLFELPNNNKTDALQFLAHIIEAFPEVLAGTDVLGNIMKREQSTNTALGKGWACPHALVPFDKDLMCVIGWSPIGIDYGAADGNPVALIIMYLVPKNQRSHYLREISILAKAFETYPNIEKLHQVKELKDVRNYLLDLIDAMKGASGSDARARMIRLQAKLASESFTLSDFTNLIVEPVTLITSPGMKHIALTQNQNLMEWLDSANDLIRMVEAEGMYQNDSWRILRRSSVTYQGERIVYDCLAIRQHHTNVKK
jgi:mannitol/fructose-specific phosphotransferase system IIA component (Ntr-type)